MFLHRHSQSNREFTTDYHDKSLIVLFLLFKTVKQYSHKKNFSTRNSKQMKQEINNQ